MLLDTDRSTNPSPSRWTAERVSDRLVAAFRALPTARIYSTSHGVAADGANAIHAEALSWPRRFGIEPERARVLLMRCHCLATGTSFRERLALSGLPQSTAEDRWRRAAADIARELSAE